MSADHQKIGAVVCPNRPERAIIDATKRWALREEWVLGTSVPALVTVGEVARHLRVKRSTVHEWAQAGKIPAAKVGRLCRFHREEIDTWVRKGGSSS